MPKVSVYLTDELAGEVRRRGLPLSTLAQQAVQEAIRAEDTAAWVQRLRAVPAATADIDMSELMAAVRADQGS